MFDLGSSKDQKKQPVEEIKKVEDDIQEDIVEDIEDDKNQNLYSNNELEGIGASASLGIDQSIDTLNLNEYDYVEDIRGQY